MKVQLLKVSHILEDILETVIRCCFLNEKWQLTLELIILTSVFENI